MAALRRWLQSFALPTTTVSASSVSNDVTVNVSGPPVGETWLIEHASIAGLAVFTTGITAPPSVALPWSSIAAASYPTPRQRAQLQIARGGSTPHVTISVIDDCTDAGVFPMGGPIVVLPTDVIIVLAIFRNDDGAAAHTFAAQGLIQFVGGPDPHQSGFPTLA